MSWLFPSPGEETLSIAAVCIFFMGFKKKMLSMKEKNSFLFPDSWEPWIGNNRDCMTFSVFYSQHICSRQCVLRPCLLCTTWSFFSLKSRMWFIYIMCNWWHSEFKLNLISTYPLWTLFLYFLPINLNFQHSILPWVSSFHCMLLVCISGMIMVYHLIIMCYFTLV